jgi:predicted nucleic acid-binding Zn ribbon protein
MTARASFCDMQCILAAQYAREHADRWAVKESLDRKCEACGAALPTRHPLGTKYCNRHCKDVAKVARLRSEARAVIEAMDRRCEQCGVSIDVDAPLAGWAHKFCTLQCCAQWYDLGSRRARAAQKLQEVQEVRRCALCDKAIPSAARSDARYCSSRCQVTAKNRRR